MLPMIAAALKMYYQKVFSLYWLTSAIFYLPVRMFLLIERK